MLSPTKSKLVKDKQAGLKVKLIHGSNNASTKAERMESHHDDKQTPPIRWHDEG